MARRLLLLTNEFGDAAIQLADALKFRGYQVSPYAWATDSAKELVHETPVVLLLAETGVFGFIERDVKELTLAFPEVRFINVLLREGTQQMASGTTVNLYDFSPFEIRKVVEAIELNLASVTLGHEQPSVAIAWDPAVVEPDEYAELVSAIANLARAAGAAGIRRLKGRHLLRSVNVEAGM